MTFRARATFTLIVSLLLFLSLAVMNSGRADDLTGMAQDDAKELLPPSGPTSSAPCYNPGFLPMPSWARGAVMPPLPDVLKPMGKKVVLTTPPVPAPAPQAPPKDSDKSTVVVAKPTVVAPAPAPNPALIAVSPFLDWIKANPQAAAEQARQQASVYQAGDPTGPIAAPPAPNAAPNNTGSATTGTVPIVVGPAPYWMPPLIDAAPFTSNSGNVSGSSAAIYSRPQQ
jgi:hypothetical protein